MLTELSGSAIALLLLTFCAQRTDSFLAGVSNSKTNSSRPGIFALRCDEGAVLENGVLVVRANEPTEVMLIGRGLDTAGLAVAITPMIGSQDEDCTHTDRVKSFHIRNISAQVAYVTLNLPSPGIHVPFYFCVRSDDSEPFWRHQGTESWLQIRVRQDLLPLYGKLIVIAILLGLSGLFSGLNLGLMALDKNELQVIISCGTESEKRYARAIEPVRRRGNYLLCSILFSNVLVNSTIAVLLEELTSGIVAVMTSTIFIVMFGEILPQAFCSRHGLAVGAKTVSLTYFCMIVTFPLSWPVSSMLDWALGEEIGHAYDRERLMEFIRVTRDYNNLEADEVNIISGALRLKHIQLSEVMTRIEDVFMLDVGANLDFATIQKIIELGYSRVPVHEPSNRKSIVALLFAKDLALLNPDDNTPIQTLISFYQHPLIHLFEDSTLDSALNEFKTGKSHLAFIRRVIDNGDRDPIYEVTGIVTLEDVIEEIMQMEINDETDSITDNRRKRQRSDTQTPRYLDQFSRDQAQHLVSPQLRLAAYQYLVTLVPPFAKHADSVLRHLLSKKIYFKVKSEDPLSIRRLYSAGEPTDYFVMLLEGRAHVTCGREQLVFDCGPFSSFGKPALVPESTLSSNHISDSSNFGSPIDMPNLDRGKSITQQQVRRESFAQIPSSKRMSGQWSISMRKLEQTLGESDSALSSKGVLLPLLSSEETTTTTNQHQAQCIPDYTVDLVTDATYLKITRAEYQAAVLAAQMEREVATEISEQVPASERSTDIEMTNFTKITSTMNQDSNSGELRVDLTAVTNTTNTTTNSSHQKHSS